MNLAQHQARIDKLNVLIPTIVKDEPTLIKLLGQYVESADVIDVKSDRAAILKAVKAAGYVTLDKVPVNRRNGDTRANLALCIIGNLISAKGTPPPNIMARFVEQHGRMTA